MAMLGSVITKDMEANSIYGGNPAIDLTLKLGSQFEDRTIEQKIESFSEHLTEYIKTYNPSELNVKAVTEYPDHILDTVTYYNLSDRTYTKTNNDAEVAFNKWLFKYKSKFIPRQ
jgi:hypothetical protein